MAFTPEGFNNFQRWNARMMEKFGTLTPGNGDIYASMDDPFEPMLVDYVNRNPKSPLFGSKEGNTYTEAPKSITYADESGRLVGESVPEYTGFYSRSNPLGWDTNKLGNARDWENGDVLPNGMTKAAYVDKLKSFDFPQFATKPQGFKQGLSGVAEAIKAGVSSPGVGITLMAAGLGTALGAGGVGGAAGGAFDFAAADALGLQQMGQAAGLSGSALSEFVASGGALGSTAAGGGGVGFALQKAGVPAEQAAKIARAAQNGTLPQGTGNMLTRVFDGTATAADVASLASPALSLISGALGANAAGSAADAQERGVEAGIAEQRRQFDLSRADQAPFRETGVAGNARLRGLLGLGGPDVRADAGDLARNFTMADRDADPVYQSGLQFGLDEGRNAINARAIGAGGYDSGATLKALTRYGNDYGSTKANESYNRFNNNQSTIYNRLAGVSGSGQTATNQVQAAGTNMANQVSDLYGQGANARAAGIVGGSNAWGSAAQGINSSLNNYNSNRTLQALLAAQGASRQYGGSNVYGYGGGGYAPTSYNPYQDEDDWYR